LAIDADDRTTHQGIAHMHVSEARKEANRQNALKSTGPKTDEGKARSRGNAIKHGLCAVVCIPEDVKSVLERSEEIYQAFKPYTDYQAWNVERAATLTLRIERSERMERRVRDKVRLRAELSWDDDRRLEVEVFAGALAKKPAETVEGLRRTPHGCEWLMTRWALLAHAADTQEGGEWTPEQTSLAFDLMATPAAFREGRKPGASLDFHGRVLAPADGSAAVARRMVDELMIRREEVADLDEVERHLASVDLDHDSCAELRRLRRYESALHTRLRWTVKQMQFQGPEGKPDPALSPIRRLEALNEKYVPEEKTEDEKLAEAHDPTSPHPPFCLTPDEFPPKGQRPDIPAVLKSRKAKKRRKVDERREADREKARKLHA
jgi:hypothetical protein